MSKKCLAIAKKAMVWTLAASMLVATPLTASAAGLRGVYSVSDGTSTWDKDGNASESNTGTVTTTDTNTTVLGENDAKIIGIVLDKTQVNAEKGKPVTLKATVVLDEGVDPEVVKALNSKIKWEVQEYDGEVLSDTNNKLSITVKADDRSVATLNPRQGTVVGEDMKVVAKIDGKQTIEFTDETTGKKVTKVFDGSALAEPYTAFADVFIKEYANGLGFDVVPDQYETHTVDMYQYLNKDPESANDTLSWSITSGLKGAATINASTGLVTIKKFSAKPADAEKNWVSVTVVSEKGLKATATFNILQAVKAGKVGIYLESDDDNKCDPNKPLKKYEGLDFGTDTTTVDVKALMFNKQNGKFVKDDKITDKVTWTSNKPAIVTVTNEATGNGDAVTLTALSAGKATITAKTSSGKKATLAVTVKATLNRLEIVDITETLYSGQSVQMDVKRTPAENKDSLKWSIEKVDSGKKDNKGNAKMIANPNASINSKGVLTIKNKVDENYPIVVRVTSKTKGAEDAVNVYSKGLIYDLSNEITVEQSNVTKITVTEVGRTEALAWVNASNNKDKMTKGSSDLSVPKTKTYQAVTDPSGLEGTLQWSASGNNKIVKLKDNGDGTAAITAVGKGKATITVSGVYAPENKKPSTIKATFKVEVRQPAKTITLNKTLVVLNEKTKKVRGENVVQDQKVSFKATLGPKGVDTKKEIVTWSVDDASKEWASIDSKGKLTLKAPTVGKEVVVTARATSGVYATATVKILKKTDKVVLQDANGDVYGKSIDMVIGQEKTEQIIPKISIKGDSVLYTPGDSDCETVEYAVNKKGIVTVDEDGTIHAIKAGTVTITVKTPTNKKATLKVVVKNSVG